MFKERRPIGRLFFRTGYLYSSKTVFFILKRLMSTYVMHLLIGETDIGDYIWISRPGLNIKALYYFIETVNSMIKNLYCHKNNV